MLLTIQIVYPFQDKDYIFSTIIKSDIFFEKLCTSFLKKVDLFTYENWLIERDDKYDSKL